MGPGVVLGLGLLLGVLGGAASEPHSLRYFYVAVSEPSPGVPQFVAVGYVDGIPITRYDSETRREEPKAEWMRDNLDQQYWDGQTQIVQNTEQIDRLNLDIGRARYNQSGRGQTWQRMYGCDLLDDGTIRGYYQSAFDGKDFIAFDMDTMTFTAADEAAQVTKWKWEKDGAEAERWKHYLENICIEWLRRYVSYGRAVLERKEPPTVRVSGKVAHGILTLSCRAYGFYPRPIAISWLKDGEVRDQETEWGSIAPNSDGTYYLMASIEAKPEEKDKYRCRVDHASLPEPGLYALEPESNLVTMVVVVVVAIVAVVLAIVAGVAFWKRHQGQKGYGVAPPERGSAMGPGVVLGLGLLLGVLGGAASEPHSLRYFHVAVSEPSPGVPQFVEVGYVDGIPIARYDSETRRVEPKAEWMRDNLDQEYWDRNTRNAQNTEQIDRLNLDIGRARYNQSGRAQTWQRMYGCDLLDDGTIRGYYQGAYDGKDFLAFDMDTMTFTAADEAAQVTKWNWEKDGTEAERWKHYLENTCIEWLRRYVSYGRAVLERKEPPTVRVSGKVAHGILTLSCRAYGFYPRPIAISWLKDGEVRDQETEWGSIAPNSDGTYYLMASIEAKPKEKDKYRCRVDHASLPEPGLYAWEPESNLVTMVAVVVVAILAVVSAIVAGVAFWKRQQGQKGYGVAPRESRGPGPAELPPSCPGGSTALGGVP
ncbi:uncharacterized protein AAHN32_013830 [Aegotheles albertisi]